MVPASGKASMPGAVRVTGSGQGEQHTTHLTHFGFVAKGVVEGQKDLVVVIHGHAVMNACTDDSGITIAGTMSYFEAAT